MHWYSLASDLIIAIGGLDLVLSERETLIGSGEWALMSPEDRNQAGRAAELMLWTGYSLVCEAKGRFDREEEVERLAEGFGVM